eukprot:3672813-Pyramimonas_sp.AAC.1
MGLLGAEVPPITEDARELIPGRSPLAQICDTVRAGSPSASLQMAGEAPQARAGWILDGNRQFNSAREADNAAKIADPHHFQIRCKQQL